MEMKKLLRIALAVAVAVSGAAMYAKDASATCATSSSWTASACATSGNGAQGCSWGEVDGSGNKHVKGTSSGGLPLCGSWSVQGLRSDGLIVCSADSSMHGNGVTVSGACPSTAAKSRVPDACLGC
jgi:hypothetical protein